MYVHGCSSAHRHIWTYRILRPTNRMSHGMMHVQKKIGRPSWILEKRAKNTFFIWYSAYRPPGGVVVLMKSDGLITCGHLVLHYFRYKMAAEVCQYLRGSSSAHRLDGPHVLYIIITSLLIWNKNITFTFTHKMATDMYLWLSFVKILSVSLLAF